MKHCLFVGLTLVTLSGCVSDAEMSKETVKVKPHSKLEEMESLVLCKDDAQGVTIKSKIKAEYGFKKFAKNAYRPVIKRKLFGHEVRVIELGTDSIKVYAAGTPEEFVYNLKYFVQGISCEFNTCQGPLDNGQSLLIYTPTNSIKNTHIAYKEKDRRVKDTTILECTRAPKEELPEGTE